MLARVEKARRGAVPGGRWMSSVRGFTLELSRIEYVGQGLVRPECVIVEPGGTLWTSDARGIATRIEPDGRQATLGPEVPEPNGMAMDRQGNLIVASMSGGKIHKLHRDGRSEVLSLSDQARTLVLLLGAEEVARIPIELARDRVNLVRW